MNLFSITVSFVLINNATPEFNKHFAQFVEENYGRKFLDALQRSDLGDSGSFGGKTDEKDVIKNDPVVFVHGVSDFAGGKMQALAATYRKHGYTSGELYATSYDDGPRNNPISWAEYSLKCEHVKRIRTLILAVRYYTLKDVDIVAYSLGVPLARKAVLGGICVDTKEDLGAPLTSYIDSFIGVAGPNHGISFQVSGLSIPGCVIGAIPILPICSKVIGLYSGFCPIESTFLTDINESNHYEGKYVYSLYTEADSWIGYRICDQITARIPGEDGHKLYKKFSHDDVILRTCDMQLQMLRNHTSQDNFDKKSRQSRQAGNSSVTHRKKIDDALLKNVKTGSTDIKASLPSMFSRKVAVIDRTPATTTAVEDFDYPEVVKGSREHQQRETFPMQKPNGNEIDMFSKPLESVSLRKPQDIGFHTRINVSFERK